jgi:threonine 3-dehydrogenase
VSVAECKDTAAWFREQNEGYGVDVVFEMSGAASAITDAFKIVRNGGRVILFGIPSRPVEIDVAEALIFKNLNVLALNGRRIFETWYKTRWMLESGVVDLRPLITRQIGLEQIDTALQQLEAGEACKIVLRPDAASDAGSATRSVPAETAGTQEGTARLHRHPKWTHR